MLSLNAFVYVENLQGKRIVLQDYTSGPELMTALNVLFHSATIDSAAIEEELRGAAQDAFEALWEGRSESLSVWVRLLLEGGMLYPID